MIIDEKNPNASMGPSSMYPPPPPYSAIAASWQRPPTPPLPPPTFTRGPTHRRDSGGDHDAVEVGLGCARHTTPAANVHNSDNVISIGSSSSPNRGSKVYGNLKGKASCRAQAPVRFSTLPSHILLQIVYSTFPQTDGVYEGGETVSKVERQRENLFWMEMSLRLVNRALYVGALFSLLPSLASTYLGFPSMHAHPSINLFASVQLPHSPTILLRSLSGSFVFAQYYLRDYAPRTLNP